MKELIFWVVVIVGLLVFLLIYATKKEFKLQKEEEDALNEYEKEIEKAFTLGRLNVLKDSLKGHALEKNGRYIKSVRPLHVKKLFTMIKTKEDFIYLLMENDKLKIN